MKTNPNWYRSTASFVPKAFSPASVWAMLAAHWFLLIAENWLVLLCSRTEIVKWAHKVSPASMPTLNGSRVSSKVSFEKMKRTWKKYCHNKHFGNVPIKKPLKKFRVCVASSKCLSFYQLLSRSFPSHCQIQHTNGKYWNCIKMSLSKAHGMV